MILPIDCTCLEVVPDVFVDHIVPTFSKGFSCRNFTLSPLAPPVVLVPIPLLLTCRPCPIPLLLTCRPCPIPLLLTFRPCFIPLLLPVVLVLSLCFFLSSLFYPSAFLPVVLVLSLFLLHVVLVLSLCFLPVVLVLSLCFLPVVLVLSLCFLPVVLVLSLRFLPVVFVHYPSASYLSSLSLILMSHLSSLSSLYGRRARTAASNSAGYLSHWNNNNIESCKMNEYVTNQFFLYESSYRGALCNLNRTSKILGEYLHSLPRYGDFLSVRFFNSAIFFSNRLF